MATAGSSNFRSSKSHQCNLCGKTFENAEALSEHKRLEHNSSSHPPAGVG
ncbi:MAG TPA: C2H2-type zinc finger protein [Nitrososphaeraceae archaeon]|nr:C2H2-type zinc finger protein [Nitrososphaeraceae archaeon]